MNKLILAVLASLALVGCGNDRLTYITQAPALDPQPTPQGESIASVVERENRYRYATGQSLLTPGAACSLYTVPQGTYSINGAQTSYVGSFTYEGEFNQENSPVAEGLSLLPENIRALYTSWYIVRCTGQLVIVDDNFYNFEVSSDDGSVLQVGGLTINNDGNHAVVTKSGATFLRNGVHYFQITYMQGPASMQALIVKNNGEVLSSDAIFH